MTEANASEAETTQEAVEGEAQAAETETETTTDSPVEEVNVEAATDASGEAEREREARRKANREAQNLRERLRKFEEAEEQRKQEAMTELERVQAQHKKAADERDEAKREAKSIRDELVSLRVRQEATSKALSSGAKQERLDAVLRLTDLSSEAATDEDGNPDPKAIEAAIKATLKAYPEFRAGARDVGGPTNPVTEPPSARPDVWNMPKEQFEEQMKRISHGERFVPS